MIDCADVDLRGRVRELELLRVGVDGDEVDLRDPGVHHPVDRVDPGAADADDADHGEVRGDVARDVEARRALGHRRDEAARGRRVRLRNGLVLDRRRDLRDGLRNRCDRRHLHGRKRFGRARHGRRWLGPWLRPALDGLGPGQLELVDVLDRRLERHVLRARASIGRSG